MKLRNKKTGEIGYLVVGKGSDSYVVTNDEWDNCGEYKSLAKLNEDWEDYKEPGGYWCITQWGGIVQRRKMIPIHGEDWEAEHKAIGNYFETKEEAEKAVEKLKAWKRMKDKGFRFDGWNWKTQCIDYNLDYRDITEEQIEEAEKDLDLLFGGEE